MFLPFLYGWFFGSFQTWNFLDSTATPWTDVNFVDDQFLRTLGNTLFSFLGFGGTFQSEVWYLFLGLMILWMFFRFARLPNEPL
ncbi:hypothetical protein RhiirA5_507210 [Rhizophagus irregularis]|uniref:Uncharacterized protein n=1 Tax=Rhizophagus irregularis TaxID=588596 RepID=A0A2N0NMC9_9GLOM|nr:hypothetical protein RhiirA5_507210 [Rhizophagus irregularis]